MFYLYSFLAKKHSTASPAKTHPFSNKIPGNLVYPIFPRLLFIHLKPLLLLVVFLLCVFSAEVSSAQIGGKTVSNGPFLVDGAEDLNVTAESLGRDWVSDFVKNNNVLTIISLQGSTLTLDAGQSPLGAFLASVPVSFGSISGGFGIPLPSVVGASTLDSPGNVNSFSYLNFFECHEPASLPGMKFQVTIQCYPENGDGTFPTVFWNYTPKAGKAFGPVSISLKNPDGTLNNPTSLSASTLLAKTRYLYFYFFASPVSSGAPLIARIDDVQFSANPYQSLATASSRWNLYQ